MASKADFTEDEWKAMQKGVMGAGMLVSLSDAHFTDSFGEASAIAKYLAEQSTTSTNPLIRELAHTHGSGFGLTASLGKVEAETLEALRAATATISAKAPDDIAAYRELVLGTADHAAQARGGVKPGETSALEKITQALG